MFAVSESLSNNRESLRCGETPITCKIEHQMAQIKARLETEVYMGNFDVYPRLGCARGSRLGGVRKSYRAVSQTTAVHSLIGDSTRAQWPFGWKLERVMVAADMVTLESEGATWVHRAWVLE